MATAMRAKDGLAIRVDAAHQKRSRATMVPIKMRTNRMLKDRAVLRLRIATLQTACLAVIDRAVGESDGIVKSQEEEARPWGFEP